MVCKFQLAFPIKVAEKYFAGDYCLQQFDWPDLQVNGQPELNVH